MKSKKILLFLVIFCCFFCLVTSDFIFSKGRNEGMQDFGVFLGINGDEIEKLKNYRIVVIEPSEFRQEQISALHQEGKTVYAYLNIGSLEDSRPYYSRFQSLSLGKYENWQGEYWMDVSFSKWQDFLVKELGAKYTALGIDGFFLDNADVYYHYPREEIYEGLCAICSGLKTQYACKLLINGGDSYVKRCIDAGRAASCFDGINQESVFTKIDFEKKRYLRQNRENREYFQDYLLKVKRAGLLVCLTEYRASPRLARKIAEYCREHGFLWYNAPGLELR